MNLFGDATRREYIIRALPSSVEGVGVAPFGFKGAGCSSTRRPRRRYFVRCDLHFITFSCYRRRPLLETRRARHPFPAEWIRTGS